MAWLAGQPPTVLWLTAITLAEVLFGISQLPEGRRRSVLQTRFDALLERGFPGRILPFDRPAAEAYATIMAARRALGRPMSVPDGQIAAEPGPAPRMVKGPAAVRQALCYQRSPVKEA